MATATLTLTPAEATAAVRALRAHPAYAHNADAAYAVRYAEATGIAPAWLTALAAAPNRWFVRHNGYTHETTAATEADAVNVVRFRLYGATAAANLPPFEAICPARIVAEAIAATRRAAPIPAAPAVNGASATARTAQLRRTATARTAQPQATRKPSITKADALTRLRRMATA